MDFLNFRILDALDIVLVALLLFYIYKLVKGTVAIKIFIGIVIFYLIWKLTQILKMQMLSGVFGEFIDVGMVVLIVVFQHEIRRFLLLLGSTNFGGRLKVLRQLKFLSDTSDDQPHLNIPALIKACYNLGSINCGALIIVKKEAPLDAIKNTGDKMNIEVNTPILESIFYKNSPLHDGAAIIEGNTIVSTRAILPISDSRKIPLNYGLRHRAAIGATEKTDALALVVSEETGNITCMKDGHFVPFKGREELTDIIENHLK